MKTSKTKLRRKPARGSHERQVVEAILDEALLCHVGVIEAEGFPVVTPMLHVRIGDQLYLHGSAASRTLRRAAGSEICLTATLLDGLVLARAAMHHSANYRSAIVFGSGEIVDDPTEKLTALQALVEKLVPGRWADVRPPTDTELRATSVVRLPLQQASAKIREGPPLDDEPDHELPVWAGVIGLRMIADAPQPDERLLAGVQCPDYVRRATVQKHVRVD